MMLCKNYRDCEERRKTICVGKHQLIRSVVVFGRIHPDEEKREKGTKK